MPYVYIYLEKKALQLEKILDSGRLLLSPYGIHETVSMSYVYIYLEKKALELEEILDFKSALMVIYL